MRNYSFFCECGNRKQKKSVSCKPCDGKKRKKENNPNWKGGIKRRKKELRVPCGCGGSRNYRAKRCRRCESISRRGPGNPRWNGYERNGKERTEEEKLRRYNACECGSKKFITSISCRKCSFDRKKMQNDAIKNLSGPMPFAKGKRNSQSAGYYKIHEWVRRRIEKNNACSICGKYGKLDLSNKSGDYLYDLGDWEWLCRRCHMEKDGRLEEARNRMSARKCMKKEKNTKRECRHCHSVFFTVSKVMKGKTIPGFCSKICRNRAVDRRRLGLPEDHPLLYKKLCHYV